MDARWAQTGAGIWHLQYQQSGHHTAAGDSALPCKDRHRPLLAIVHAAVSAVLRLERNPSDMWSDTEKICHSNIKAAAINARDITVICTPNQRETEIV